MRYKKKHFPQKFITLYARKQYEYNEYRKEHPIKKKRRLPKGALAHLSAEEIYLRHLTILKETRRIKNKYYERYGLEAPDIIAYIKILEH